MTVTTIQHWGSSRVKLRATLAHLAGGFFPMEEAKEILEAKPSAVDIRNATATCDNCPYARWLKRTQHAVEAIVLGGVAYALIHKGKRKFWRRYVVSADARARLNAFDELLRGTQNVKVEAEQVMARETRKGAQSTDASRAAVVEAAAKVTAAQAAMVMAAEAIMAKPIKFRPPTKSQTIAGSTARRRAYETKQYQKKKAAYEAKHGKRQPNPKQYGPPDRFRVASLARLATG